MNTKFRIGDVVRPTDKGWVWFLRFCSDTEREEYGPAPPTLEVTEVGETKGNTQLYDCYTIGTIPFWFRENELEVIPDNEH